MHRKTLKWWKKPFFHLLTLCSVQTNIILNKHRKAHGRKTMPLDTMVKSLLRDLPAVQVEAPEDTADGPALPMTRLTARHFPDVIPPTPSKQSPYRNCVVCYARDKARGVSDSQLKNQAKRTRYWCRDCQKPLCVVPCFGDYHQKKNYDAV